MLSQHDGQLSRDPLHIIMFLYHAQYALLQTFGLFYMSGFVAEIAFAYFLESIPEDF